MRRQVIALAVTLALTACTGEDKQPESRLATSESPTPKPVVATAKPTVSVPKGPPPTKLVKEDLVVGTGDFALPGKVVSVHYVGVLYDGGKEFDSSWRSGHPFQFQVGNGDVIPGWDEGILGMRVGGRRKLIIPPELAYGPQEDDVIPANSTLVFVVDLITAGGQVGFPVQPT